jgi:hypothetical protein
MVDTSAKIDTIIHDYVERGRYFVINRARQFGKTTTLELLYEKLSKRYLVISLSFEGREGYFKTDKTLVEGISTQIKLQLEELESELSQIFVPPIGDQIPADIFNSRIIELCKASDKPVILMIDEVDRAASFELFASFLGLLRTKYLARKSLERKSTFHSVILAGVHDIKNLKSKIRGDKEPGFNSPWNIAADFTVDMSFSATEIATMLSEFDTDHESGMDASAVAERLFYYTNGYPFLVSALCQRIHNNQLSWTIDGVDQAASLLVQSTNTLFDDVIKNIETHNSFKVMVEAILIRGEDIPYIVSNYDVNLGLMFGIFRRKGNYIIISNRIFEKYIYEHLLMQVMMSRIVPSSETDQGLYIHNGRLDMMKVLDRFAQFMRREYRRETASLVEAEGRLLFLAYLRPIINGVGSYYVEAETRGSTRMDVVVEYGQERFIVELKIWRGEKYEQEGLNQVAWYCKTLGETQGYLLSFCDLQKQPREGKNHTIDGIEIHEYLVAYRDNV